MEEFRTGNTIKVEIKVGEVERRPIENIVMKSCIGVQESVNNDPIATHMRPVLFVLACC
jgi:hypothetical protein